MGHRSEIEYDFPDPRSAPSTLPLAAGGELTPEHILCAYREGIFPWYNEGDPVLWWSPDPRLILYPGDIKVSKSFRRTLRKRHYRVGFDEKFPDIIKGCAEIPRPGQKGTWLNRRMQEAYIALHRMGYAHSVEVYMDDDLAGGLYGIALGGVFFGESMFSLRPDASKIALKALSDVLSERSYDFIDCQIVTGHLLGMGAVEVDRNSFLDQLEGSLAREDETGSWSDQKWEYCNG